MQRILLLKGDDSLSRLEAILQSEGRDVSSAQLPNIPNANELKEVGYGVLIVDLDSIAENEEFLARLRYLYSDVAVVFATDGSHKQEAIKEKRGGAFDYLVKPSPQDLELGDVAAIVSKAFETQKFRYDALIDSLTGLLNKRGYETKLSEVMERVRTESEFVFSQVFFDIDHFKQVNDKYGHLAGNDVLIEVARIIRDNTKESDIVCRYGGEEFVVILTKTGEDEAYFAAEKIRGLIGKNPFIIDGQRVTITISAGVATYKQDDTLKSIIERADKNLYRAKQGGRDRTVDERSKYFIDELIKGLIGIPEEEYNSKKVEDSFGERKNPILLKGTLARLDEIKSKKGLDTEPYLRVLYQAFDDFMDTIYQAFRGVTKKYGPKANELIYNRFLNHSFVRLQDFLLDFRVLFTKFAERTIKEEAFKKSLWAMPKEFNESVFSLAESYVSGLEKTMDAQQILQSSVDQYTLSAGQGFYQLSFKVGGEPTEETLQKVEEHLRRGIKRVDELVREGTKISIEFSDVIDQNVAKTITNRLVGKEILT